MMPQQKGNWLLNDLIESELGAVETYHKAVESASGEAASARNELRQIENDHRNSVEALGRHLGLADLPTSPGQWKRFVVAMQDTFRVFDNPAMIRALKEGETRLARQYEQALHEMTLAPELAQLIESALLPRALAHAQSMNRFIVAQTSAEPTGPS